MSYRGLTKEEYIGLLKECGMCTKKWTLSKMKDFEEKRKELIEDKKKRKRARKNNRKKEK